MNYKMYKPAKAIFFFSFIFSLLFVFWSCDTMEDVHAEYIDDGEKVYIPRPLEVETRAGLNRILLTWKMTSINKVDEYVVNYGDNTFTIPVAASFDTLFTHTIDNLDEGNYIFKIQSKNSAGYASLESEVNGNVYGEVYKNSLTDIRVTNLTPLENGIEFYVSGNQRGLIGINAQYTNLQNIATDTFVEWTTEKITLDVDVNKPSHFRTAYLPEVNAFDTVYTDLKTLVEPVVTEE